MTIQETIKQLNILLSRERYLLGCSSDEHQHSQMIEALEVAKEAVEKTGKEKKKMIPTYLLFFAFGTGAIWVVYRVAKNRNK